MCRTLLVKCFIFIVYANVKICNQKWLLGLYKRKMTKGKYRLKRFNEGERKVMEAIKQINR